ncbi:MAG: hypothetical protein ACI30A_05505 [Paludibacteraceae bacterium]
MKKIFFLLVALATLGSANANVIFHEDFDREAGTLNKGANTSMGTNTTDWWSYSGTNNYIQVAEGSLSYAGYVTTGKGNKAELTGNGADDFRQFNAITSGKVYVAAIINVDSLKQSATADYFFTMGDASTSKMYARLYARSVKKDGSETYNGVQLGIAKANEVSTSTTEVIPFVDIEMNQNYLVVLEYEFVDGTKNDTARLYINPTKETAVATLVCNQDAQTASGNPIGAANKDDAAKIASVNLRKGTNTPGRIYIDEIKVATTWDELFEDGDAPEPQPVAAIKTSDKISFGGMVYTGETYTASLQVTGENLTDDITITCDNEEITFSTTTITKETAMSEEGATVEVTLTPAKADMGSATITLTSGDAQATTTSSWWTVAITNYATLAEVKAAVEAAGENGVYVRYTGEAIITYVGTDTYNNALYYIQDATAAMQVGGYYAWADAKVGDKITNFVAENASSLWGVYPLDLLNGNVTILSSDNSVEPQVVTLADLKTNAKDYLLELVKVEDVTLDIATPQFAQGNTQITQDEATANINLVAGNELIGENKPSKADVTGFSTSAAGTVIRPRGKADIVDKTSGTAIENVAAEAETEIYTVSGMRVSELQPGVNIIRKGEKTYKVIR